ncbi:MAG TPA: adenylate/guanylate cyclase domain-containing protein [Gaiellaceae bacterium]|jgi:class 3 adenylate cyclase|nr:adenylate/guanylate cyclase domain-containing protein [Gaiellaceae bacterium]
MPPETRYVRSGDVSIAYQVLGEGPFDVVFVPGFVSHVELVWATPPYDTICARLASYSRLLVFDKRGSGMSDRVSVAPTLETRMDDVRAVMDAAGSSRAALVGVSEGAPMSTVFAATYPERTWALVLLGSYARELWAHDYPWAPTEEQYRNEAEASLAELFGPREQAVKGIAEWLGGHEDEAALLADYFRRSASPGSVAALNRMNMDIDVRHVLPAIRAPTLLVHGSEDHIPIDGARWMAGQIPAARLVELPGARHVYFGAALGAACDAIEGFLTEAWESGAPEESQPERVLATVLFTDIVGSSEKAASLGDRAWRELLERHHELVRRQLVRFRGREVDTAGDGFFASFDGPARAIRCACAVADSMSDLALDVRVGLHTGECELIDGKVAGIAVHTGARVATMAQPGEVLVSSTVKDLVAGSGLEFDDRGTHKLKGIPGEWQLYSVAR